MIQAQVFTKLFTIFLRISFQENYLFFGCHVTPEKIKGQSRCVSRGKECFLKKKYRQDPLLRT